MGRNYPKKPKEVYFFATCLVELFYPEAGLCGMQLLQREGVRVVYPKNQTCCGQPAYSNGRLEEARAMAIQQLSVFPEDWPVVLPSGSCAGMIRKHYPELLAGTPYEVQAHQLANRTFELTEFLVHVLNVELTDQGQPVSVTWHGSCHSQREMGVVDEPKHLLNQLTGVTLSPLQREKECCGFGGTFAVRRPELSEAMVADKVKDAESTGATKLVSGDCGCLMNIDGHLKHTQSRVSGTHIAEFLWERTHAE
ncbi:(Fe-S)-binding protein [Magnetococcus sp. PR-3]|uniref:(Fe-S)-binding protein n=1 Tax=Magnetococcus sp. PR-3 TaxID=3120355 RepID=UPI003FA5E34F